VNGAHNSRSILFHQTQEQLRPPQCKAIVLLVNVLISVSGPDSRGLVAGMAAALYDQGLNLGDTSFAVLGTGFEFNAVAELPQGTGAQDVLATLKSVEQLRSCEIVVREFEHDATHNEAGMATHAVVLRGGDQPGLIARLAEVLIDFDANIVRLNADRIPGTDGHQYVTSCDISVAAERAQSCLAALANTAGQLQLTCEWRQL